MENELEKNVENTENKGSENKPEPNNLEARIKALESENAKLRQANTNASADASKWKKQYQEMLPEKERLEKKAEARKAERKEAEEKLLEAGAENVPVEGVEAGEEAAVADDREYVTISSNSLNSLINKVQNYSFGNAADRVLTSAEKMVGGHIDFKG